MTLPELLEIVKLRGSQLQEALIRQEATHDEWIELECWSAWRDKYRELTGSDVEITHPDGSTEKLEVSDG